MSYRTKIEEELHGIGDELEKMNDLATIELSAAFDGTKATYDKIMRKWFLANGANTMTAVGLTALCEKWYTLTRDGWDGYTAFAQPSESTVSTGTKGGDNAGKTCTPSTDSTAGTDDYAGLPLFACVNVNYTVDPTSLDILVTAIEGITDNYVQNDPATYVGVMQMTGWHYWYDTATTYVHGYADHRVAAGHCMPLPEAVRTDGTIRAFVVHSKYMSHTVSGKMTSCAGLIPTAWISHNNIHTLSAQNGTQYSGGTTADYSFLRLMVYIKYASLTLDGIMQGCCSYNYQYYAQVAETGVKRIILPAAAASNLKVGSSVLIGAYTSTTDRGNASLYSISTNAGVVITAIETVTINDTTYTAVYVDIGTAFDTAVNGDATAGTTIVSTFHWKTGTTDSVLGNDGSPGSNTSGVYPFKAQGIEFMMGGYEVLADVIMVEALNASDNHTYYTPHIVRRSAKQATSVTSDYKGITELAIQMPAAAGWHYPKRWGYAEGVFYPTVDGTSSSQYTKDGFYMDADGTTGNREWLGFGSLYYGSGVAGLGCLDGDFGLPNSRWYYLGRLSPNGNRGEWAA